MISPIEEIIIAVLFLMLLGMIMYLYNKIKKLQELADSTLIEINRFTYLKQEEKQKLAEDVAKIIQASQPVQENKSCGCDNGKKECGCH